MWHDSSNNLLRTGGEVYYSSRQRLSRSTSPVYTHGPRSTEKRERERVGSLSAPRLLCCLRSHPRGKKQVCFQTSGFFKTSGQSPNHLPHGILCYIYAYNPVATLKKNSNIKNALYYEVYKCCQTFQYPINMQILRKLQYLWKN